METKYLGQHGKYLLFRRTKGKGLKRKYAGTPRFRHDTMLEAETEGQRLKGLFPDSTFMILMEVAVVK